MSDSNTIEPLSNLNPEHSFQYVKAFRALEAAILMFPQCNTKTKLLEGGMKNMLDMDEWRDAHTNLVIESVREKLKEKHSTDDSNAN